MEKFDPAQLDAFLILLVERGVEEFEGYGIHVRFTSNCFTPSREVIPEAPRKEEEIISAWHDPSLWPGGKPPQFPR